ncbi:hypothetical protein Y032_0018g3647 [Ancylostoma ceylanicum]|uniref:Uncharacterized protein n=1 Tax=Ancylostoma ceylanicum TaxID=53326 RepID=A0A016V4R2_9BILA|nr:hypothetical protein Y032_0018g3647 [Ancylostoma ceylanicum]
MGYSKEAACESPENSPEELSEQIEESDCRVNKVAESELTDGSKVSTDRSTPLQASTTQLQLHTKDSFLSVKAISCGKAVLRISTGGNYQYASDSRKVAHIKNDGVNV